MATTLVVVAAMPKLGPFDGSHGDDEAVSGAGCKTAGADFATDFVVAGVEAGAGARTAGCVGREDACIHERCCAGAGTAMPITISIGNHVDRRNDLGIR
jgi:hypothetical protein